MGKSQKESNDLKRYKEMIDRLKSHPDNIETVGTAIKNIDMLSLILLSGKKNKHEAILFAVDFTISNMKHSAAVLNRLEEKARETHKLSCSGLCSCMSKDNHKPTDSIADASVANKQYQGKYMC